MISESEFISNTIVNGKPTENIHLVSLAQNGNVIVQGHINNKPISILRNTKTKRSRKSKSRKRVKFSDNQSVSAMDSMPNPFEPTIVYRNKKRRKTQKRRLK